MWLPAGKLLNMQSHRQISLHGWKAPPIPPPTSSFILTQLGKRQQAGSFLPNPKGPRMVSEMEGVFRMACFAEPNFQAVRGQERKCKAEITPRHIQLVQSFQQGDLAGA